ncbi:TniQ family protein [Paraburkholderia sp. J76]|uniref:TniQ family protein n=1 Tax=Paraburkholderia sp. J76 TaxID=2805439 RepID=UPI002ABD6C1E|nr:TniQ family protein [Paraburkholderia sp. J76]
MTKNNNELLNMAYATTSLYSLTPKGVGTQDCESILSFMARLAAAHNVSLNSLCEFVRTQTPDADWLSWRNPVVNLSLRVPDAFIETVIRLTGNSSLQLCSLDRIRDLVHLHKSKNFRIQRHCPICVQQAPYPGGWNRLLWTIGVVEACPEHGVALSVSKCGADRKEWVYQGDRSYLPGVCRSCRKNAFGCIRAEGKKASAQQMWVARQVGELIAAVSEGKEFSVEHLRTGINRIIQSRWPNINQAAKSLGLAFTTLSLAATGNAAVSLRLLLSLCSAVDIRLVDLLRGKRTKLGSQNAIVFTRYFRSQKQLRDEKDLRRAIRRIMDREPDIRIGQLADRVGVQTSVFYRKLPDVVQQIQARRLERVARDRWRSLLSFARKLRAAKRQLDEAGCQFTTVSVFRCVKVVPRSDAEIRLFHFVRRSCWQM